MLRRFLLTTAMVAGLGVPMGATAQEGIAGPYLAARLAAFSSDYAEAAHYFGRLLQRDASNPANVESAMIVFAAIGDFDRAATAARLFGPEGSGRQLSNMVLLVEAMVNNRLGEAATSLSAGAVTGPLLDGLLLGWTYAGLGQMAEALDAFETLATREAFAPIAHVHRAFVLAMVGDFEGADDILSGRAHGPLRLGPKGIQAHAQILAQLERRDAARDLLDQVLQQNANADLAALRAELEGGGPVQYTTITTAQQGMAEAFFALAAVVNGEASDSYTLLHARASMALDPRNADAALLSASILEGLGQYQLASAALDTVPEDHPAFVDAEIARSEVLYADGDAEAAAEVLRDLAAVHPERRMIFAALGDTLRRTDQFEEARSAYSAAIALSGPPEARDWFLFYARAVTNERTDRWPEAMADFDQALVLNPEQPLVLNYYGYSLVEKRQRLDEALAMIEKAVEGRPDDGYITDSLGWVLYRLGRFPEAVAPMERAVALTPLDAVINDHLGDVYWMVGRKREAEFQWRRALSFIPEVNDTEAEPDLIRRKLEVGLDVVLSQEGGADGSE